MWRKEKTLPVWSPVEDLGPMRRSYREKDFNSRSKRYDSWYENI